MFLYQLYSTQTKLSSPAKPLTLQEIVIELTEVTEWHQLGVQLNVPPATLRTIESNYPRDAQRQKIEVLIWWYNNAPEISWEKLAQAVEAVGGHAALAKNLRLKMNPTPTGWEFSLINMGV